jgi:hypothetical protein
VRRARPVALLLFVVAAACQKRPTVATARELLAAPERYDGERIVLAGLVQNPRNRMPAEGPDYTSFTLVDGTDRVPVIAWGTVAVGSGDVVEVRGVFHAQMVVGGDVLHDTVEAAFVRPFRKAPQPPGTPAGPP